MLYKVWRKSKEAFQKRRENGINEETLEDLFVKEAAVKGSMEEGAEEFRIYEVGTVQESLHRLWERGAKDYPQIASTPLDPNSMLPKTEKNPPELTALWEQIEETALLFLAGVELGEQEALGSGLCLCQSEDLMRVWMFVFPSPNGEALKAEQVEDALQGAGVVYGINEKLKEQLLAEGLYFKILLIAEGIPAINGVDGVLTECIPRDGEVMVGQREDGSADYKSGGYLRLISKGDVICRMEPPTEGTPGINVRGARVPAIPGSSVHFPKIKNAELSEDGLELHSAIDGNVHYENDRFIVEAMLVIDGNVDGSVGNIDYDGDVFIEGDVREGFRVKATGNVVIKGMVECAEVYAEGHIVAEKGMNGNMTGILEAKGDIRVKFLENAIARSFGDIYAGSIIWSDIFCRGSLYVNTGRGVIIGGNLVVLKNIEAEHIGNSSRRPIDITLGTPPEYLTRREELEQRLVIIQQELSALMKDLEFLENKSEELRRKKQYGKMRLQKPLLQMQEQRLTRELATVYEVIADANPGTIRCGTFYPPARLHFGAAQLNVTEIQQNCMIFEAHGQITIGGRH